MSHYFARFSFPYETLPQSFYENIPCDALVIYEHPRDELDLVTSRTHIHALMLDLDITIQGLKNRISHILNKQVNKSDWSFKKANIKEVPKILCYMAKGKYDPKYHKGWDNPEDAFTLAKEVWEEPRFKKPMRQLKITQQGAKEYRQTYNDLIDKIINLLEEGGDYQTHTIITTIISVFRRERIIIGRYKIRDIHDTIMMRKLPDHYIQKLISDIRI